MLYSVSQVFRMAFSISLMGKIGVDEAKWEIPD